MFFFKNTNRNAKKSSSYGILSVNYTVLTYNVKLFFESEEEKLRIISTLEAQRYALNEASKLHFGAKKNSIVELHAKFYKNFRAENQHIPADVVITAEQECLSNYRSAKSNKHKLKKPVEKKNLSYRLNKNLFAPKWEQKLIKLTAVGKSRVTARLETYDKLEELMSKYQIADPLLFVKKEEIWLALSFKTEKLPCKKGKIIGCDLGIRITAAISDGRLIQDKKFNKEKRRLRYLKRCLQGQAAKNSKAAKRHLKKLRRKERNKNKNQCHKISNEILKTDADIIVIEDLTKIKTKKHKGENKNMISQIPFYQLRLMLGYKAGLLGKEIHVINPKNTSQNDYRTGRKTGERRGRRYYGKDGVVLDADLNAANNIALKLRNKHPDSTIVLNNALDGQADVNQPYDYKSQSLRGLGSQH